MTNHRIVKKQRNRPSASRPEPIPSWRLCRPGGEVVPKSRRRPRPAAGGRGDRLQETRPETTTSGAGGEPGPDVVARSEQAILLDEQPSGGAGVRDGVLEKRNGADEVVIALRTRPGGNVRIDAVPTGFLSILRKEVIQPQVPLRLPCYDLVPITGFIFGACLSAPTTSDAPRFGGLTGGVYKAQEHIHRGNADPRLLAIPASCGRVAARNPN